MVRSIVAILISLVAAVLIFPGISNAAEPFIFNVSKEDLIFTVIVEKNVVYVKNGMETVQKISCDDDMREEPGSYSSVYFSAVDMNFDGFLDLRISNSLYTPNVYYSCYLWQPESQRFKKNESLGEIPNLSFDKDTKKITGFCHESAMDNWEGEYSWVKGENRLILLYLKTQRYRENKDLFVVTEERLNKEGAMATTQETYFNADHENGCIGGQASLDERTREMISEVAKELLGACISGDEQFHAESITDGKDVSVWLLNLENGDIACFEVPDDRSGLYLNMGSDKGTFRVNFKSKITLGDRVY